MAGLKTSVLSALLSISLIVPAPAFAAGSSTDGSSTKTTKASVTSGTPVTKASDLDSTGAAKSGGNASTAWDSLKNLFGSSDPAEDKAAAQPTGLQDSRDIITSLVKLIYQQQASFSVTNETEVNAAYQKYINNWQNCVDKQASAATWCLETNNSDLQNALSSINMLASTSGLASVTDSCSTMGKIMNIGSAALTAYSAQCGVWRSACALSCVSARSGLETLKKLVPASQCKDVNAPPTQTRYANCNAILNMGSSRADLLDRIDKELNMKLQTSIAKKTDRCTSQYVALLGSAALGLANLAKAAKDSNKCEKESNATDVAAQSVADKCADTANANLPECICLANPRTAGCSSGLSSVGEQNAGQGNVVTPTIASGGDTTGTILPGGSDSNSTLGGTSAGSGGDSGLPGAPTGGGSGLGGSGGGSGSGVAEKGAGGKGSGLNTDILSGAGGGGGGGFGGYGGGSDGVGGAAGYRNYLPGGSKDPARGLAGQAAGSKDVTGQAGKSNWEKVRDRYIDNKSTLLGN